MARCREEIAGKEETAGGLAQKLESDAMSNFHIQIPPMPKPEDFGITQEDWSHTYYDSSKAKIAAYKEAVEAWKHAVGNLKTSG
jgi:hypothetical protein